MELNKSFSCCQAIFLKSVCLIFPVIISLSCKEEPLKVGQDILPDEDTLGAGVDTFKVKLYTVSMEPTYTRTVGESPLGYYIDPVFGRMKAEFITDFTWYDSLYFKDGLDEDSIWLKNAEMFVYISGSYVDTAQKEFEVYELIEEMPHYGYSDFEVTGNMYDPTPLNIEKPNAIIDTTGDIDKIIGYRFLISNDFAQRLLDTGLINTDTIYYSRTAFREHFPGFYFAVKKHSIDKGIINIDHYSSVFVLRTNRITNKADTIETQNLFYLGEPPSENTEGTDIPGTSLNIYQYVYSTNINLLLNDTVNDQTFAYLQSLTGPKVLVSIPGLFKKRREYNYKASVSKAELILPIDTITFDKEIYKAPQYLGIRDVANDTNIIDDGLSRYFGGVLDTTNMEYRFNIGNYIHYFMRDSLTFTDERLYLFGAEYESTESSYLAEITYFSQSTPGRVVLHSVNANKQPILRIIYSKLP